MNTRSCGPLPWISYAMWTCPLRAYAVSATERYYFLAGW
jgi:hypothetical protein